MRAVGHLQAHPDATLDLPDGTRSIDARAATGDEHGRSWTEMRRLEPNLDV